MEGQTNGIPGMNQTEVNIGEGVTGVNASGIYADNYNGVEQCAGNAENIEATQVAQGANWTKANLPTKIGFWGKVKAFLLTEIKVELTPKQKKIEREINEFLSQEITWFGKKKKAK